MVSFLCTIALAHACAGLEAESMAHLTLYNPTRSEAPSVVEVPVGRIAAPGLVDWNSVRLFSEGTEVPFAIREGRAHWRSALVAPVEEPRAEDIVTFTLSVPPGATRQVRVVEGVAHGVRTVTRSADSIVVEYPGARAVFEPGTGRLVDLESQGKPLLTAPLDVAFHRLAYPGYELEGAVSSGYQRMTVTVRRDERVPYKARLVGESASAAMTELRWLLEPESGPAMGLTYRVYATGTMDILADERPWDGDSPWMEHAVDWTLSLAGEGVSLPYMETRAPFYGFKDHAAAFQQTGVIWHLDARKVFVTGEEAANGRVWRRRIVPFTDEDESALVALHNEGLVIAPFPRTMPFAGGTIAEAPPETTPIQTRLTGLLRQYSLDEGDHRIALALSDAPGELGIEGDGFLVRRRSETLVELAAGTVLGLYQAVRAVEDHLARHGAQAGFPLVASNPVVPFRAGGFGGGTFEVDFPYGTEDEWQRVFDDLLDSGMNVLTCLGMWGNWKMPVSYRYMPELYSDDPAAYDESTGVLFTELDAHREHALRLTSHIQERGGQVWLWLPIGCVPTTFSEAHPEAMMPGGGGEFWGREKGIPCFTHEKYHAYLDALLRELIETYPIDGLMLVRDDNGALCECERCQAFVASSRTKHAAWEQYLIIYDMLHDLGFEGGIAVYPYFDAYTVPVEATLPGDMYIVGHGASIAGLTRDHAHVGHMADTWLDNLYTNFRLPSSHRVRRLLSDRATFWIGGAYCGTELPWQALGHFGWEPTATPNTFRHTWALRTMGREYADAYLTLSQAYEHLWDINGRWMCPGVWMDLDDAVRRQVMNEGTAVLGRHAAALSDLRSRLDSTPPERLRLWPDYDTWMAHMELFATFFEYHLNRLDRFARVHALVEAHRERVQQLEGLPEDVRESLLGHYAALYEWGTRYSEAAQHVPGGMMEVTRNMTMPYKEWMAGHDTWLDPHLTLPQFSGTLELTPNAFPASEPIRLPIELSNTGVCPWISEAAQFITIESTGETLDLSEAFTYGGAPIAPGDRNTVEVPGRTPGEPGETDITVTFYAPYRNVTRIAEQTVTLTWE